MLLTSDQGTIPRRHSPDGATWHTYGNKPATHLSTPEGWKVELAELADL